MIKMLIVAVAVALASACGGSDDAGHGVDASAPAADATVDAFIADAAPPDALPPNQVMCGGVLCDVFERCCVAEGPFYECIGSVDSCAGAYIDCDGPDDCSGTAVCCSTPGGGSHCQPGGCPGGQIICQDMSDCPEALECCASANSLGVCAEMCIE